MPATLALTLGAPAIFGAFAPGVARDYTASTTANVISTAGDATLSYSGPGPPDQRRVLAAAAAAGVAVEVDLDAPVSNDPVTIAFKQAIGANDALRTGAYSKTLTFTLCTTTP